MRVLLARAEADAGRSAARLRALGHEPVVAPLMEIVPVAADAPQGEVQAVVLTSANAAQEVAARPELRNLLAVRAFPVGERTEEAARAAGFRDLAPPAGDGRALAESIAAACRPEAGPILHPGGRDLAVDIAASLRARGFDARHLVVYEAKAVPSLPPVAAEALRDGTLDAALLYSPRQARLLLDLVEKAGLSAQLRHIAFATMSDAVAEPLRRAGHSSIAVASESSEPALLDALDRISGGGN